MFKLQSMAFRCFMKGREGKRDLPASLFKIVIFPVLKQGDGDYSVFYKPHLRR
jgi:hypothetical protein